MLNTDQLSTRQWRRLRLRLVMMYDGRVTWHGSPHSFVSSDYTIWLVRKGKVTLTDTEGGPQQHGPNTWILIPPDFERQQVFAEGSEILSIHLVAKWPDGQDLFAGHLPLIRERSYWSDLERAAGRVVPRGGRHSNDQHLDLTDYVRFEADRFALIEEWFRAILGEGIELQLPRQLDERVEVVLEELNRMDYVGGLPYSRLSEVSGLSRTQIDRLFRANLGRTPHRYLEERCCDRICEQLLSSTTPIKIICFQAGFTGMAHFSRWFRRQTGRSPQQYRQQLRP